MACAQTLTGIARDCNGSLGGLTDLLIATRDSIAKGEDGLLEITVASGIITAISRTSGSCFYRYAFRKGMASFTSTRNINDNGGNYVASEIVASFTRMETAKRLEMEALSLSDLVAIGRDRNGKYWFFGLDEAVTSSAGSAQSGQGADDMNGYSITLSDISKEYPLEVSATIIADLLEPLEPEEEEGVEEEIVP